VVPSRTPPGHSGAVPDVLFYQHSESVELLIGREHDKTLVLGYFGKGGFFGEMGLLEATLGRESTYAPAAEPKSPTWRTRASVRQPSPFQCPPREFAAPVAAGLKRASRKLCDLLFIDVSGRILRALGELCEQPDVLTHPEGMQTRVSR